MNRSSYDVVIIGGSFSGLAAALQLARANRSIAILDDGYPVNRSVERSYGFLFGDGENPRALYEKARKSVARYDSVAWYSLTVEAVSGHKGEFHVSCSGGEGISAKRVIFACGPRLSLPKIDGLSELWGKTAFPCIYCHGFEFKNSDIALLVTGRIPIYESLLYPEWGKIHLLTDGKEPRNEEREVIERRGVTVYNSKIEEFKAPSTVRFRSGEEVTFAAIFFTPEYSLQSVVTESGLRPSSTDAGELLEIDHSGETSIPGVFGCGMATNSSFTIADAVAHGGKVAKSVHASFLFKNMRTR